jgi:hypothetical protein
VQSLGFSEQISKLTENAFRFNVQLHAAGMKYNLLILCVERRYSSIISSEERQAKWKRYLK